VEINSESIGKMQSDYTAMIVHEACMFRTYPINLNFGSYGGHGVVEFRCKCGNEVDGTE
jgi:hypothetical protein